jgi:hypothetical protein
MTASAADTTITLEVDGWVAVVLTRRYEAAQQTRRDSTDPKRSWVCGISESI